MNTTAFAAELGTDARTARKFLRAITPADAQPGKGGRWAIDDSKRSLATMKKTFAKWDEERKAAEAEEAAEAE